MIYQLKTYDDKLLFQLTTTDYGSEFHTTNDVKNFKDKLFDSNKEHGLHFENDMSYLNQIHNDTKKLEKTNDDLANERFQEVSERWGLKYKTI